MTIRLQCVQCQRKLKLPDEALGRKIQCPSCGARFRAGTESGPPSDVPPSPAQAPVASTATEAAPPPPALKPDEPAVVDSLFADMASHSLGTAALPLAPPGISVFTALDLKNSPPKAGETAVQPIGSIILNESETPPLLLEGRNVPVADEMGRIEIGLHPAEPKHERPPVSPARTGWKIGCLAIGLLLPLLLGGIGYGVYSWSARHDIPDEEWQTLAPAGSHFNVRMPGTPERGPGSHEYLLARRKEEMTFRVRYRDLAEVETTPQVDAITRKVIDEHTSDGTTEIGRRSILIAQIPGREFELLAPNGEHLIARVFLVPVGDGYRVYEVQVRGPHVRTDRGDAARFLNSFYVSVPATGSRAAKDAPSAGDRPKR